LQVVVPAALHEPAGQHVPAPELLDLPAAHAEQLPVPDDEYRPAWHA
jgi:hypothetical protein